MKKKKPTRFFLIYSLVSICFFVIAGRLVILQTVESQEAKETIDKMLSLSEVAPAPRGNICDRNGVVLSGNRQGHVVMIKKGDDTDLDKTLKSLSNISQTPLDELKKTIESYGLSYNNPYVFSDDADAETITKIKENPEKFPCIDIITKPVREYFYPDVAVHLLGRCGLISKEEYEKNPDYRRDDQIGKQGAEKAFESILKGTDGRRAKEKYTDGTLKEFKDDVPAQKGRDVHLTIDINLQKACEDALSGTISKTYGAVGGAAIIMDVRTGEILAAASYPDYNLNDFNKKYDELTKDKNKPFFVRYLSGLYEPGSTFKPITAIAALESEKLDHTEKMHTKGKYEYFDRVFRCHIYRETGKTHKTIDVTEALGVSCNYFFYELGKRTGIDVISNYAHSFGLDSPTGIELTSEEAIGTIATPDNREKSGRTWYGGDVLQAAIGQSDNRFTPIALCNYAAALANGGTLYSARVLSGVKENDGTFKKTSPKILNTIDISEKTLQTIREGMKKVAKSGTAKDIFHNFPVEIAAKTGTAQVGKRTNGLFIGYAPADAPEISFCVVIEGATSGNLSAKVSKGFLTEYFDLNEEGN